MDHRSELLDELEKISISPPNAAASWFQEAEDGVAFLLKNSKSEEVILYANAGFTLIHGVLVPEANVTPPDFDDLEDLHIFPNATWFLEHSQGGGEPERMFLAAPLDSSGCDSTRGGEKLIFQRHFTGVDKESRSIELSQQLVHALELYWMDEYSAFCRLNVKGDIEPVVRIRTLRTKDRDEPIVTILADDLHRYMAVTGTALVRKFDFMRYPEGFSSWEGAERRSGRDERISYNMGIQNGASFIGGVQIIPKAVTCQTLIEKKNKEKRGEGRKYASFMAWNVKTGQVEELSCAPTALASYFEPDSPLPLQITPAFFRPDVFQRYKADPDKYTLDHRSISSRAGWTLKTFDINKEGQVHTYLWYLGELPYSEQLYWQSCNEEPRGMISKRAFETDILGVFSTEYDPLVWLLAFLKELDEIGVAWWNPRGEKLLNTLHYPVTTSAEEWSSAIMTLDQTIVEGLLQSGLTQELKNRKLGFEREWKSLKLLETLIVQSVSAEQAVEAVEPLKRLHDLRSKVKGHASGSTKDKLIKSAIQESGSLKQHFECLLKDSFDALKKSLMLGLGYNSASDLRREQRAKTSAR